MHVQFSPLIVMIQIQLLQGVEKYDGCNAITDAVRQSSYTMSYCNILQATKDVHRKRER